MSEEKICGIYCIENLLNGKKYIGLSSNIYKRFYNHKVKLKNNYHINEHLQDAWNKYGEENFKFYILENCDTNIMCEREIYYINILNSSDRRMGYNMTCGGEGVKDSSGYIREKMSLARTENSVLQFDKLGNFIKKYRNCKYAEIDSGLCINAENIRLCCKKSYGRKTLCGFIWMYENDYILNGIDLNNYDYKKSNKQISQYDLDDNFINTYESARQAEKETGIGFRMISRVCNGDRPYTHGYIFRFTDLCNKV